MLDVVTNMPGANRASSKPVHLMSGAKPGGMGSRSKRQSAGPLRIVGVGCCLCANASGATWHVVAMISTVKARVKLRRKQQCIVAL